MSNPTPEKRCVRCANGDSRTPDGFHSLSTGGYKRCADLPPYEPTNVLSENCPKCGTQMSNWPRSITRCAKCGHEWAMKEPQAPFTSNVVSRLRSERVCNTLGHKMLMHEAADEIERLTRERDQLLSAIGEHVTVRSDQYAEIQRLRAALEPFAKLHEARTTIYQKRGGNPDSFPDSHPAYDITASQLRLGIWRRAAEAYFGGSSDETFEPLCQMSPAAADVIAERLRQLTKEGWTPAHDDEHDNGQLAKAAACYAAGTVRLLKPLEDTPYNTGVWPWSSDWWKPKDRRRDLVRAGALILAEIERLDRASEKASEVQK